MVAATSTHVVARKKKSDTCTRRNAAKGARTRVKGIVLINIIIHILIIRIIMEQYEY